MERRDEPRFPVQIAVQYSVVGTSAPKQPGNLRDISEGGSRINTAAPLTPGAFVKLEFDDAVFFGEIRYCCPWLSGYVSGLLIERVLLGSSDFSQHIAAKLPDIPRGTYVSVS
jgi:hypothetical protein